MLRFRQKNLKESKTEVLDTLNYELWCVENSYSLLSNDQHPVNESRTPEYREELIKKECLKERIAFFKSLIKFAKDFKYQEEN